MGRTHVVHAFAPYYLWSVRAGPFLIPGVTTRRLNEQVKRNPGCFPPHFIFRLTKEEKGEVVAICDHLIGIRNEALNA